MPHTSQLFGFEKEYGNCIRLIPHLGCQEIVEAVFIKLEQGNLLNTLDRLDWNLEDATTSSRRASSRVREEKKTGQRV